MRIQYAALNDLESVVKDLTKLGKGKLVLYFDAAVGWVATDEIELLPSKYGAGSFEFKAKAYGDWMRPHVANAVSALGAVRFLPASDMDKLFRKPIPLAPPPVAPAAAAQEDSKSKTAAAATPTSGKQGPPAAQAQTARKAVPVQSSGATPSVKR